MRTAAEIIDALVDEVAPLDATPDMLRQRRHEFEELAPRLRYGSLDRDVAEAIASRLEARAGWLAARAFLS